MDYEVLSWIAWVAAGIIPAILAAAKWGGMRMLAFDLITGLGCSIVGGWMSAAVLGDWSRQLMIISTLTALFVALLGLFVLNRLSRRPPKD